MSNLSYKEKGLEKIFDLNFLIISKENSHHVATTILDDKDPRLPQGEHGFTKSDTLNLRPYKLQNTE